MLSRSLFYIPVFIFLTACETKVVTTSTYLDVDSLINAQVKNLSTLKARVKKNAVLGNVEDQSELSPDSLGWATELDVFRQLDVINKPSSKGLYAVRDGDKDISSNLSVRSFEPLKNLPVNVMEKLPVRWLKVYYYQNRKHLKKLEAVFAEKNNLHFTTRTLNLEFDDRTGESILSRYSMEGMQKMTFSDTVQFRITGDVLF